MAVKRDGFGLNIHFIQRNNIFFYRCEFILCRIFINTAFHCHAWSQKWNIFL